jgi:hypothetical protein
MLILSASSCSYGLVLILVSTVFREAEAVAAAFFKSISTEERVTNLVDMMEFKALGVSVSNPFMSLV